MAELIEYIDYDKATIAILRDYHDKQWKIDNDPQRLAEIDSRLTSPRGTSITPARGGGGRWEDSLCDSLDRVSVIRRGYTKAINYNTEFLPCWKRLTDEERNLLTIRFVDHLEGNGIKQIMQQYNIGRSEAYRRSDKALRRLSCLIF